MPKSTGARTLLTDDHNAIRRWVESREGVPATVASTRKPGEIGLIRVMFPKTGKSKNLEEISWDDFFAKFDENDLQFLYQEKTSDGKASRFFKFVKKR